MNEQQKINNNNPWASDLIEADATLKIITDGCMLNIKKIVEDEKSDDNQKMAGIVDCAAIYKNAQSHLAYAIKKYNEAESEKKNGTESGED